MTEPREDLWSRIARALFVGQSSTMSVEYWLKGRVTLDAAGRKAAEAELDEEGFEDLQSGQLAESFARHLLTQVDTWQERGFAAVARGYLSRLQSSPGTSFGLADNGDLLIRSGLDRAVARRSLAENLEGVPAWLDTSTGGPR